jgi:hypothetical protein
MSTFFVPIGKEIGDCWGTEHLQAFWRRAFRKAGLPLRSGRDQKVLNSTLLASYVRGRGRPPPPNANACPLASGCYESRRLLQGRVGHLKVSDLRGTVDYFRQGLQHFWIATAEVGFRIFFLVPKTDRDHVRTGSGGDEYDFVSEAVLFLKEGKDLVLDCLGKFCTGIGLQVHGNVTSKHVNLLGLCD